MSRQPREVYGFGAGIPTRPDRFAIAARIVLVAAIAGVVLALILNR